MTDKDSEITVKVTLDTTDFNEKIKEIKNVLGGVERIVPLEVKPGDIIVVESGCTLRPEDRKKVSQRLSDSFGNEVQVLDGGMKVGTVLRK